MSIPLQGRGGLERHLVAAVVAVGGADRGASFVGRPSPDREGMDPPGEKRCIVAGGVTAKYPAKPFFAYSAGGVAIPLGPVVAVTEPPEHLICAHLPAGVERPDRGVPDEAV